MPSPSTNSKKLTFKPRKGAAAIKPVIPTGKWHDSIMPKGKFKFQLTRQKPDGSGADPMLLIPIKLGRADDEENASYQGAEDVIRVVFFDEEDASRVKAANMNKRRLRSLCEAVDVDFEEVYPTDMSSEDDFEPLIEALSGKSIPEMWTRVTEREADSGEMMQNIDFFFSEPRGRAAGGGNDEEEENDKPARGKASKGKRR